MRKHGDAVPDAAASRNSSNVLVEAKPRPEAKKKRRIRNANSIKRKFALMRVSKEIRDAVNVVRESAKRYPTTRRDPYNLGLYLWDLTDQELMLHLRDAATAVRELREVQRSLRQDQAKAERANAPMKKRSRERSATPPRRKQQPKGCQKCGVHNNRALVDAHGRKPNAAEWALWRLDNPKHHALEEAPKEQAEAQDDPSYKDESGGHDDEAMLHEPEALSGML